MVSFFHKCRSGAPLAPAATLALVGLCLFAAPAFALVNAARYAPEDALAFGEAHDVSRWLPAEVERAGGLDTDGAIEWPILPAMPDALLATLRALYAGLGSPSSTFNDTVIPALDGAYAVRLGVEGDDLELGWLVVLEFRAGVASVDNRSAADVMQALRDARPNALDEERPAAASGYARATAGRRVRLVSATDVGGEEEEVALALAWRGRLLLIAPASETIDRAIALEADRAGSLADCVDYCSDVARHPKINFETGHPLDCWLWVGAQPLLAAARAASGRVSENGGGPDVPKGLLSRWLDDSGVASIETLVVSHDVAPTTSDAESPSAGGGRLRVTARVAADSPVLHALVSSAADSGSGSGRENEDNPDGGDDADGDGQPGDSKTDPPNQSPADVRAAIPADVAAFLHVRADDAWVAFRWVTKTIADRQRLDERLAAPDADHDGDRDDVDGVLPLDAALLDFEYHTAYPLETLIAQLSGEIALAWFAPSAAQGDSGDPPSMPDTANSPIVGATDTDTLRRTAAANWSDGTPMPELLPDRHACWIARVRNPVRAVNVLDAWLRRLVPSGVDGEGEQGTDAGEPSPFLTTRTVPATRHRPELTYLLLERAPFYGAVVAGDVLILGDARLEHLNAAVDCLLGDRESVLSEGTPFHTARGSTHGADESGRGRFVVSAFAVPVLFIGRGRHVLGAPVVPAGVAAPDGEGETPGALALAMRIEFEDEAYAVIRLSGGAGMSLQAASAQARLVLHAIEEVVRLLLAGER